MAIGTEIYAKIRKFKNDGVSMRHAADALGISRKTVKRYWDGAHMPGEPKAYPQTNDSNEKAAIMDALRQYYEENAHLSKGKQTINAKTAWRAIRGKYSVGESTVRRYVREMMQNNPQAFIPLDFEPGEAMQVDWTEVKVCIKGRIWKVQVFCAVLPYSYDVFAMALPNAQWPNFMAGHIGAFEHFGGVPERVFYDNLKSAVLADFGKNAVKQERFKLFEAHYGFEAVFMNAYSGNEKGAVENLCSTIKKIAFTPIPKADSLKEIQKLVASECLAYRMYHKIKGRPRPILEMSAEERPCLNPLPAKRFEAYETAEAIVGSDLTFRYESTKYSLPLEYNGKTITLRILPYEIEAWHKGSLAYRHARPFDKGENQYIPQHYLPLLEERPRALRNAAPLKRGVMPPELETFKNKCTDKDKYEQLANILLLGRSIDAGLLLDAVNFANKTGAPTLGKVELYLNLKENKQTVNNSVPVSVAPCDLTQYDALLLYTRQTDGLEEDANEQ
jgi:transposase